jgi:hypothetical protein
MAIKRQPPPVVEGIFCPNPIDAFIERALRQQGIEAGPEADRRSLIRRVTLDLTGLPPTREEVSEFLNDARPDAYERLVDRLLASPAYGERMATLWLDMARYADTNGYEHDNGRNMWPWRDWVVAAFNRDMPFDQFTVEQLAGDLLPDATFEQRLATGFNRNHGLNFEGGSIAEESRWNYVHDRVHTVSLIWLGLSLSCARCHDHKYDPISQEDYYKFATYFNNVDEEGYAGEKGNAPPLMRIPDPERQKRREELIEQCNKLRCDATRRNANPEAYAKWKAAILSGQEAMVAPADMICHYSFDQADGLSDRVSGAEGSATGTLQWKAGYSGEAISLDGHTWIDLGTVGAFDRDSPFSLVLIIRPAKQTFAPIVGRIYYEGYGVCWQDGRILVQIVHRWNNSLIEVRTRKQFPPNQWMHLAITYEGTSRAAGLNVYVNGKREPCEILNDSLSGPILSHTHFYVGVRHPDSQERFVGCVDELRIYDRPLSALELALLADQDLGLTGLEEHHLSEAQEQLLWDHFTQCVDVESKDRKLLLRELERQLVQLDEEWPTVMVMAERQEKRPTHVLLRGQYDQPGQLVEPGLPAWLAQGQAAPKDRLELARWLVSHSNPFTARVIANRQWELFFGRGLVASSDNFGTQGEKPSHPELLDWLADELRRDWDLKRLHRLIVTSAAYRRALLPGPEHSESDPENRWLAWQTPRRLTAEMIRDAALAVTGLLDRRMGGHGVFPYQPPGLWSELAFHGGYSAQQDALSQGGDLYRRSLYTYWKRTCPPPLLTLFDAPDREVCQVTRPTTSNSLQALALLNDPTFVQAAGYLAQSADLLQGELPERVAEIFEQLVCRPPCPQELAALCKLYQEILSTYSEQPGLQDALREQCAVAGLKHQATPSWCAWTIVIHTILISDSFLAIP